jgi:hypothetical protein
VAEPDVGDSCSWRQRWRNASLVHDRQTLGSLRLVVREFSHCRTERPGGTFDEGVPMGEISSVALDI